MSGGPDVDGVDADPHDNPVWWSLASRHRPLAEELGRARRYRTAISVFAAVDAFDEESWSDLAGLVGPSRHVVLLGRGVPIDHPAGWVEERRIPCRQMTVDREGLTPVAPVAPGGLRRLTADDVPLMVDLVDLTEPGPFRAGTIAMGHYYGYFEGSRLLAMAGERMGFAGSTEISAVCTHPDARRRGLGAALTRHVAVQILGRGEQPFLHVAESNEGAQRVYERLGFSVTRFVDAVPMTAPPAAEPP